MSACSVRCHTVLGTSVIAKVGGYRAKKTRRPLKGLVPRVFGKMPRLKREQKLLLNLILRSRTQKAAPFYF